MREICEIIKYLAKQDDLDGIRKALEAHDFLESHRVPVSNEWIEWNGGECPVSNRTLVDYCLRDGDEVKHCVAELLTWQHVLGDSDIIAYRVSK